jgi:hypothetical protein
MIYVHPVHDSEVVQFASPFDPTILRPSLGYYSNEDREYVGSVPGKPVKR